MISHLEGSQSPVFSQGGLCFDIRFWIDIIFKTSSDSHPSFLDRENLFGWLQNGPGQRWCHVVLKSFSSWSTTRKKKKFIFLEFSAPSRCPQKVAVSETAWATLGADASFPWLCVDFTLLSLWRIQVQKCSGSLFFPRPPNTSRIPSLQTEKVGPLRSKGLGLKEWFFPKCVCVHMCVDAN